MSFIPSSIDLPVRPGREKEYLPLLKSGLALLPYLSMARRPDLAVVVAGSDPYEKDTLPGTAQLLLTKEQLFRRDVMVYTFLAGLGVPQCWLMAGGYGEEVWRIPAQFLRHVLLSERP